MYASAWLSEVQVLQRWLLCKILPPFLYSKLCFSKCSFPNKSFSNARIKNILFTIIAIYHFFAGVETIV